MGTVEGDLDVQTEQAWTALSGLLVEVMEALEPKRFLYIEAEVGHCDGRLDGAVPYVQVMRLAAGVHVEASSNRNLASRFRLSKESRRRLRSLGLAKPGVKGLPNYWANFRLDRLDTAAQVLVSALREGFGVIHPAFLTTDQPELAALVREDGADLTDRQPRLQPQHLDPWKPCPGEQVATYPDDGAHLQQLVIEALTPMLGIAPEPDADGDIAVQSDTSVVLVCVAPDMPHVTLHADVVRDVRDLSAAVIEAGLLNRDTPGVQFTVNDGVVAARTVLCSTWRAQSAVRACRTEAGSRRDDLGVGVLRLLAKRNRRIRAAVKEAVRQAERARHPSAGAAHDGSVDLRS